MTGWWSLAGAILNASRRTPTREESVGEKEGFGLHLPVELECEGSDILVSNAGSGWLVEKTRRVSIKDTPVNLSSTRVDNGRMAIGQRSFFFFFFFFFLIKVIDALDPLCRNFGANFHPY